VIGQSSNPTDAERCDLIRREAVEYVAMFDDHLRQPDLNEIQRAKLEAMRDIWATVLSMAGGKPAGGATCGPSSSS
jgi:hypothetical protein